MLDQSFCTESLRIIYDLENRKGKNLANKFFPRLVTIYRLLSTAKRKYRKEKKNHYGSRIEKLKKQASKILSEYLEDVSKKINQNDFIGKIELEKVTRNNKLAYKVKHPSKTEKYPEVFFAGKHIQYCLKKLYLIKQSNRYVILKQLECLLQDNIPKKIIRADISSFYETIPTTEIFKKLNADSLVDPYLKKIIKQFIYKYEQLLPLNSSKKGVPRGIGISAYLAELYLKDFDSHIKNNPDILYYARYVDDMIVITKENTETDLKQWLEDGLRKFNLDLNDNKTSVSEVSQNNISFKLEYLGYFIEKKNQSKRKLPEITFELSENKITKYENRIKLCIENYKKSKNENKARRLLIKRLKFITSNTKLGFNKSNILTGIYFSNQMLDENCQSLQRLDKIYKCMITRHFSIQNPIHQNLCKKLSALSFTEGFKQKKFMKLKPDEIKNITKVWKNAS